MDFRKPYPEDFEDAATAVLLNSEINCEAARSLERVIDALIAANIHSVEDASREEEGDEAVAEAAKKFLVELALKASEGHRWRPEPVWLRTK